MRIPEGVGHIGAEEYENELKALVGSVRPDCQECGEEFILEGGMEALLADVHQAFLCPNCKDGRGNEAKI